MRNAGNGGSVQIRRDPGYRVYYAFTLKVPFKTALVLATVTDGDIEVRDVEGAFDVRNVNGKVRLSDVAGSGDARTVNGGVTIAFKRHPDGACLFKTVNGDVEVDFPGPPSADFRVRTMHGEVYTEFAVTYLPKALPGPGGAPGPGRQVRLPERRRLRRPRRPRRSGDPAGDSHRRHPDRQEIRDRRLERDKEDRT